MIEYVSESAKGPFVAVAWPSILTALSLSLTVTPYLPSLEKIDQLHI